MKIVEVEFKMGDSWYASGKWRLITCMEELLEELEINRKDTEKEIIRLLKSEQSWENLQGHYRAPSSCSALELAIGSMAITGQNPIYNLDSYISEISKNKIQCLVDNEGILLNSVGGFCPYCKETVRVTSTEEVSRENTLLDNIFIKENTRWINIENDPELENYTITTLGALDENFSYLLNLRDFDEETLTLVFKSFVSQGGRGLWVYTTGTDEEQMYTYTRCAVVAGIQKFMFTFNAGDSNKIREFSNFFSREYPTIPCSFSFT